ncbi:hypothetical protein KAR91_54925, partial [Candidatus Pacearchaeota archaeon]|nr:hypothetical protein [Candidatus Pacearchaeota archaeon]
YSMTEFIEYPVIAFPIMITFCHFNTSTLHTEFLKCRPMKWTHKDELLDNGDICTVSRYAIPTGYGRSRYQSPSLQV